MNSHLTALVADEQRADLHRAAARSRRARSTSTASQPVERPRRLRRLRLRNRPAVA
jgi:hypothetical protein